MLLVAKRANDNPNLLFCHKVYQDDVRGTRFNRSKVRGIGKERAQDAAAGGEYVRGATGVLDSSPKIRIRWRDRVNPVPHAARSVVLGLPATRQPA
jgi:hypothetical protein